MSLLGTPRGTQPPGDWRAWTIWGAAAVFYLYEFFVRVAPSVMQEPLMEVMHVNAAASVWPWASTTMFIRRCSW